MKDDFWFHFFGECPCFSAVSLQGKSSHGLGFFLILSTNLIDTGCYCSNLPKHGASHTIFARRHDPALRGLLLAMRDEGHLAWGSMVGGPLEDRDATVDGSEIRLTTWDVYQNFRKEWDSHYKPQLKLRMVGR